METKAVIFDIDGTLTKEISWVFLTEKLGASVEKHLEFFEALKKEEITLEEATQKLLKLWQSTGNASKEYFEEIFKKFNIRSDAEEIIKYLKNNGYIVCLITGSMDLYADVISKRLGIKFYYANTELVWDEEGRLVDFKYEPEQGEKKKIQFLEFCKSINIIPGRCVIVGDSKNDYELFKLSKHGIAVQTEFEDKELESVSWKVVKNLSELKNILANLEYKYTHPAPEL